MSQVIDPTTHEQPEEPQEFYGAEQVRSAEEIPSEIWAAIDEFVETESGGRERLIPLLHMVQHRLGYLPFPVQEVVADRLGLSPIQVYGVVSFYNAFTTTPRARHQVKVCLGTSCFVRNAGQLMTALKDTCQCEAGGISDDGLFNLDEVRCIGACGLAPAITIDGEVHGNLTASKARRLADRLRKAAVKEAKAGRKEKEPETAGAAKETAEPAPEKDEAARKTTGAAREDDE
jgi:NADH:ubiquinone oxidoreductase subunit E